jgi:hypothetical protein
MSKNFRSSFLDLLCCRYSKRHLFRANASLRNRPMINDNPSRSLCRKSDYFMRTTSAVSRISQLTPVATALALTTSSSLSRLTSELSPMYVPNARRKSSKEADEKCYITLELCEPDGKARRASKDQSMIGSRYSLVPEPLQVLSTS